MAHPHGLEGFPVVLENSSRNTVRYDLAVLRVEHSTPLLLVADEAAFDENRRMLRVTENGEIGGLDSAVGRSDVFDEFILHEAGKLFPIGSAVESLNPQSGGAVGGVEVDTDKYGVPVSIRFGGSLGKSEELVASPRHDGLEAGLLKGPLQPAGHVKIDVLFVDVGVGGAEVAPAVSGIDDHGFKGIRRTHSEERSCENEDVEKAGAVRLHGECVGER